MVFLDFQEHDDGQIEILDGSNRRAYILSKKGEIKSLRALITKSKISKNDAKALAKEIRTGSPLVVLTYLHPLRLP